MFRSTAITVDTSPTLLLNPKTGTSNVQQLYVIYNTSLSQTVYLGGSDVTPGNGIPLKPESYMTIPLTLQEELYATAAGSPEVRVAGTRQKPTGELL